MSDIIDRGSRRAREARLSRRIGRSGYSLLLIVCLVAVAGGVALVITKHGSDAYFCGALALFVYLPALWWNRSLRLLPLPKQAVTLTDRLSVNVLAVLKPDMELTPQSLWHALSGDWQLVFITNHLLLAPARVTEQLSTRQEDLVLALEAATKFADQAGSATIEVGFIAGGLLQCEPSINALLISLKQQPGDIASIVGWLGRGINENSQDKQDFGGVGRDWAFGFTPLLNRFGENVSLAIAHHGARFGWLTTSAGVQAIEKAFDNHSSAIALIGPDGIGKTTSIYALAQRLIEGNTSQTLAYHQIIRLNASVIISSVRGPGELEHVMLSIANEVAHAGHVILFFDDAAMFFRSGTGSFDAGQILLPILQSKNVPIIFAFTPSDYQGLKTNNAAVANVLTPVVLQEPSTNDILRIMEDAAIRLENRHDVLIGYEALHEAYRLSGRYEQDEAYPGKAITLLEQAVSYAEGQVVSARSVQKAIEQTKGVKVGTAVAAEADTLLQLEDKIHERMINQTQAVSAVANALRRARAGVGNPKRPIGSFLFLGPTGVGKTELAKAIAGTYFNNESGIIRLDMSEYQQPDDVQRLLSSGANNTTSLLQSVRSQPFSVVLLDEIEKAHPNILNLLLQLLDEGQLTDATGRAASFKDCIIITTSNAGATTIREQVARGVDLTTVREQLSDELIKDGQFKPELLNRFDEVVVFRPLNKDELAEIVRLLLKDLNKTLSSQNITLELTEAAITRVVETGNDPRLGARPMRRVLQRAVEDVVAKKILRGEAHPGDHVLLDSDDLDLQHE